MNNLSHTALVLIGYQNDYFSPQGILYSVIEESSRVTGVLENTLTLLSEYGRDFGMVVNTPIHFTADYNELANPIGILKVIKDVGAFKENTFGAEVIPQLSKFDDFVTIIPGKRGLNAFSNTDLAKLLHDKGITDIVFAGTVTSICIDSTARSAIDLGFNVTVLDDCTSSRTPFEQNFYCTEVFPLYANVCHWSQLASTK
ncbi:MULTISPECIES: cysteine hydrolase family protein [unclassified Colwellia]|uniref:cysteine hydrolase family protein n=1 Tax=unclassified Colwellia TaxID=196834 RepID=UPI0015F5E1BF|nr:MULTISPECIES: cysteine hydrolase family protein [unclassified Colwellia]MBA6380285.1 cysteine hydrolase family protein [Colwellia sp. BRX10-7]MBA6387683.1 cysteine hydrolase family protein [Colwellia sp. BRX10-2]MBA6402707.1 cysteine hydrolase family protein [Colwellia sp. BRX10-5]MBA6405148.1 cysteine hydrolase family protein [Colwellia sp. BRX10-1]